MAKKPYKFKKQHLYYIVWYDAYTTQSSWLTEEELEEQSNHSYLVHTIGWCYNETKDYVSLTQSVGGTENSGKCFSNTFVIPRAWIKTIKKMS
tara:strand:- start:10646 stop:10924 length:279 start_codon:yes stop_codon:yes gene_type:complete